jgi:hypothetical protein
MSTLMMIIIDAGTDDGDYDKIKRIEMDGASEEKCTQG